MLCPLQRQRPRHLPQPRLADRVGQHALERAVVVQRHDVDLVAPPPPEHVPAHRQGQEKRTFQVHIEDEDVREEYWRDIRRQPERIHEPVA